MGSRHTSGRFAGTARATIRCPMCSEMFKQKHSHQVYCSKPCAFVSLRGDDYEAQQAARVVREQALRASRLARTLYTERQTYRRWARAARLRVREARRQTITAACSECGSEYTAPLWKQQKWCSEACGNRVSRRARRHRLRALPSERITAHRLFERDEWTCQQCGCHTPSSKRGTYADDAPEIDHIIAVANGGAHVWHNVQCLCRACNIAKSDSVSLCL